MHPAIFFDSHFLNLGSDATMFSMSCQSAIQSNFLQSSERVSDEYSWKHLWYQVDEDDFFISWRLDQKKLSPQVVLWDPQVEGQVFVYQETVRTKPGINDASSAKTRNWTPTMPVSVARLLGNSLDKMIFDRARFQNIDYDLAATF